MTFRCSIPSLFFWMGRFLLSAQHAKRWVAGLASLHTTGRLLKLVPRSMAHQILRVQLHILPHQLQLRPLMMTSRRLVDQQHQKDVWPKSLPPCFSVFEWRMRSSWRRSATGSTRRKKNLRSSSKLDPCRERRERTHLDELFSPWRTLDSCCRPFTSLPLLPAPSSPRLRRRRIEEGLKFLRPLTTMQDPSSRSLRTAACCTTSCR